MISGAWFPSLFFFSLASAQQRSIYCKNKGKGEEESMKLFTAFLKARTPSQWEFAVVDRVVNHFIAVTKYTIRSRLKEEFVWAHGLRL